MSAEISAVRCDGCGGSMAAVPGRPLPCCLFCGANPCALRQFKPDGAILEPETWLPFDVDETAAQAAFHKFAKSSWWFPSDLAGSRVTLRRILVPAWAWSGRLETTWAGLVSAATKSGKRPTTGAETKNFEQIVVPASAALRPSELRDLGSWDEQKTRAFSRTTPEEPFEVSTQTQAGLREAAQEEMRTLHGESISQAHDLISVRTSSVAHGLAGRPILLPVWIGAYRYGDVPYRVVVNGQNGIFVGTAPWSKWKLFFAVAIPTVLLAAVLLGSFVCAGASAVAAH